MAGMRCTELSDSTHMGQMTFLWIVPVLLSFTSSQLVVSVFNSTWIREAAVQDEGLSCLTGSPWRPAMPFMATVLMSLFWSLPGCSWA